jgi:alpha-D-xyloside xylohydrolase
MVLAFPDYPESWSFDLQYLFGESLLVAPVVRPQGEVRYYLPQGDWVDFWSEQPVSGGQIIENRVPLYRLPLFVKAGHRLALGPAVRSTSETGGQPQVVEIRHYNA